MEKELYALRDLTRAAYKLVEMTSKPHGAEYWKLLRDVVEPALEAAADVLTENQISIDPEEQNS